MKSSQDPLTQQSQRNQPLQPADTAMIDAAIDREVRCQEASTPEGREDFHNYYTSPSPPVKACHNLSLEWDAIAAQVQGGCSLEDWDAQRSAHFPRENSIAFPDYLEFPNVG